MPKTVNIESDNHLYLFGIKADINVTNFLSLLNTVLKVSFYKLVNKDEILKNYLVFKADIGNSNYKIIAKTNSNEIFFSKYKELDYFFIGNFTDNQEKDNIYKTLKSVEDIIFISEINIKDINKKNRQILFL